MIVAIIILGALGLIFGLGLAVASKKFHVEIDPKIEAIAGALPNANCGACGFPGCAAYAEAIVMHNAELNKCAPGGSAVVKEIARIMDREAVEADKKVAVIKCQSGGINNTFLRYEYSGVPTCKAATLLDSGPNRCKWGCLSMNDCLRACQFDAIHLDENGMRIINQEKCTGCGMCDKACPRHLIEIISAKKTVHILCSSHDKGAEAKNACGNKTACIACSLCVKKCPQKAIEMKDDLAVINYDLCIMCGICADACPTGAIYDPLKAARAKKQEDAKKTAEADKNE
jgi:Na+-translocating ferredoxin:NAD+ oxidoreductase RNF subunit RnfB